MNCNFLLHDKLKETGNIVCPFGDFQLTYVKQKPLKNDLCCDCQDIINDNGKLVCQSCGIVQGYNHVKEYVDFHQNRHRFIRKSVYHREYHINNALPNIEEKYGIEISNYQKRKIDKVFTEIGKIFNQVNGTRKRMISVNFILRKVLSMMGIPYKKIPISKSKKTLAFYDQYWVKIMTLIGDKIKAIIQ